MRETFLHDILLDLCKAYDALDREFCLDILEVYGVGNRTIRLLQTYWARLQMAAKVGRGALRDHLKEPPQGNSGVPHVTHDL